MTQVQDEPRRLASGYERACAVVALLTLPISAFLWVTAPEQSELGTFGRLLTLLKSVLSAMF